MDTVQWITIGITLVVIALFISEWLSVDLIGLVIISLLIICGILTPGDAVQGFSNSATLTIAFMFVLSAALLKTGILKVAGNYLSHLLVHNKTKGILILMIFAGFISAFINNTPVVAVFIPLVLDAAAKAGVSASKILIPLSFASMFGGLCTLIGTSGNILVSQIAKEHGIEPFGMFEMSPLGIVFFAAGIIYFVVIGFKLIPDRDSADTLSVKYQLGKYITDIKLLHDSPSIGQQIRTSPLLKNVKIDVIGFRRNSDRIKEPDFDTVLQEGDVLSVTGNVGEIKKIQARQGIQILKEHEWQQSIGDTKDLLLAEVLITPGSELENKTLTQARFKDHYGAFALALRSRNMLRRKRVNKTLLKAGDVLLLTAKKEVIDAFKKNHDEDGAPFLIISEIEKHQHVRKKETALVVAVIAMVIIVASFNLLTIMASTLIGVTILVLSRFLSMQEIYKAINWDVIFMIAGTIGLGLALEKTGTAKLLAEKMIEWLGVLGPVAMVSALYLITTFLTEIISNAASAVLLAPIAISAAEGMNIDAKPLLLTIMFASSASFMTPVGYQTNTMIYSAGNYKYSDFIRVGVLLNILFWLLATLLIPLYYKL